ncbi:aldo/keto reductase [Georgenia faecalis]|uniref:Aldo/keto reductase n=1 Tax=Georgenia faecalis TaxID=2483799 RepID=A0ABV9DA74_9MICO|nr:aldo/keto reductase [Georgenia faecalis]
MTPIRHLNDGRTLPAIGLGTSSLKDDDARSAVRGGLELGYRLVDTAASYGNERAVGQGIADAAVPREEVVVTTKLRGADQGYEEALAAFERSRTALDLDYVDLYLIHWPLPRLDRYVDSWRALVRLREEGLVRSIGVSNFTAEHLDRLQRETGVVPAVNQIELHPYFSQAAARADHAARGILIEGWRPLGRKTDLLDHPVVVDVAARHGVSPAQAVLRWQVQLGVVPLPKSGSAERQRINLDVFGFALAEEDMAALSGLERGRTGGDPDVHEEF